MGGAMMRNLIRASSSVWIYDVSDTARAAASAAGAAVLNDLADFPASCRILLSSLPHVAALNDTVAGLASGKMDGRILVETSTLPIPAKHAALEKLSSVGMRVLDAPVSGTGAQAEHRDIIVLASGDRQAFDEVLPVLHLVARSAHFLGPFGAGMTMKLIANHLVAVHSLAAAEALALGAKAGVELSAMLPVLCDSAAASRMLAVRGPVMVAESFDPPTAHLGTLLKDLELIQDLASRSGAIMPLLERAAEVYRQAGHAGWERRDIAEIYRYVRDRKPS